MSKDGEPEHDQAGLDPVVPSVPMGDALKWLFFPDGKKLRKGWFTLLAIAVLIFLAGYVVDLNKEKKLQDRQSIHQAYARLVGGKAMVKEFQRLKLDSQIHCHYFHQKWENEGKQSDLEESTRQAIRSEDFRAEIARVNQEIHSALGVIRLVYPNEKIVRLAETIDAAPDIELSSFASGLKGNELETWKYKMTHEESTEVEEKYSKPMSELLDAIYAEIRRHDV